MWTWKKAEMLPQTPREILDRVESILSLHVHIFLLVCKSWMWIDAGADDSQSMGPGRQPGQWGVCQSLGKTDLKGTFETCAHDLVN